MTLPASRLSRLVHRRSSSSASRMIATPATTPITIHTAVILLGRVPANAPLTNRFAVGRSPGRPGDRRVQGGGDRLDLHAAAGGQLALTALDDHQPVRSEHRGQLV